MSAFLGQVLQAILPFMCLHSGCPHWTTLPQDCERRCPKSPEGFTAVPEDQVCDMF